MCAPSQVDYVFRDHQIVTFYFYLVSQASWGSFVGGWLANYFLPASTLLS